MAGMYETEAGERGKEENEEDWKEDENKKGDENEENGEGDKI